MENKQLVFSNGKVYRQVEKDGKIEHIEIDRDTKKDL